MSNSGYVETERESASMPDSSSSATGGVRQTSDADIRPWLIDIFLQREGEDPATRIIEELGLRRHRARIDVAVVNGSMHAYEIKSDRDSLRRLSGQLEVYEQVFDWGTLVVGASHSKKVDELAPAWWRIIEVERDGEGIKGRCIREGARNTNADPRAQIELIWRDEALEMLAARNSLHGFRSKTRSVIWDQICSLYSPVEVGMLVRDALKARSEKRSA
jgi:hypothetical protein